MWVCVRVCGCVPGVPDSDGEANGPEELPGEELGVGGNPGLHLHHLLRQDWNADPEPDDGGAHVV